MPLYDHECTKCQHTFEDMKRYEERQATCPKCSGTGVRVVSKTRRSQLDIFEPRHFEIGDPGDDPLITSKRQLADECNRRGIKSRYLMEGYRNNNPPRWI